MKQLDLRKVAGWTERFHVETAFFEIAPVQGAASAADAEGFAPVQVVAATDRLAPVQAPPPSGIYDAFSI